MGDPSLYSMKGTSDQFSEGPSSIHHGEQAEGEESGWTTYLEDFSNHQSPLPLEQVCGSFRSSAFSVGTSSLISDAASRYHDQSNTGLPKPPKISLNNHFSGSRKLSLTKKMRAKKTTEEDPLEDTASSPVSSPKVDDYKRMDMDSLKSDEHFGQSFFANRVSSYHHHQGIKMETAYGRNEQMGLKGHHNNNVGPCTNLKNRGLCLVPLSPLFTSYLG